MFNGHSDGRQQPGPPTATLNRTVVTSFASEGDAFDDGVYVLHVVTLPPAASGFACASSDRSLQIYDRATMRRTLRIPDAHASAVTDLSAVSSLANNDGPSLVVSSGEDGYVRVFDARSSSAAAGRPALAAALPSGERASSASVGLGALVAVGSDRANVRFFDVRRPSDLLGTYSDAHTDDVTVVRFRPPDGGGGGADGAPLLLTASEDGLACTHDTTRPSEDAALRSVLNVGAPVRSATFFGPNAEGVICLTGNETASAWHHDSAQPIGDYGGHALRETLREISGGTTPIHSLVGCDWDATAGRLRLVATAVDGDAAVFRLEAGGSISLDRLLRNGHKSSVRTYARADDGGLLTGGEDARVCEWTDGPTATTKPNTISTTGGKITRKNKKKRQGHAPY